MNFKHKTGFINLRISNENKYKLSLNMYCLRRWGQWKRQSPCKAGARPTPAQFHFDQWNVNTNTNVLFNVNQWMINTDHKLQQQEKTTWKNNKKRVNKWIVHFLVRHDAEWKKWRRIFTGLASIWRNARARQIQKANPKGMHLSYNNIDRYIFDQKDNNIEDYRDVASFSTSCRPALTSLQQSIIHCQR